MFQTGCPRCDGQHAECELCGGTGKRPIYRCPQAAVGGDTHVLAIMDAYYALDRFGVWPAAGGLYDQSPYWLDCVRIIEAERGEIAVEAREQPPPKHG